MILGCSKYCPNLSKKVSLSLFFLVGDKWYLYSRENISYDTNNLLVERIIENRKDGVWISNKRYLYLYNSKNKNTSEYYQKWENEDWVSNNRRAYTYKENDSLIFLTSARSDKYIGWKQTLKIY